MTLVALLGVACGSANRAADEAEQEAIARVAGPPAEEERQAVIDAYLAVASVVTKASAPPNPSDPALEEVLTGSQLDQARAVLREMAAQGISLQTPDDSQAREVVTSVRFENNDEDLQHLDGADEIALLEVCTVDDVRQVWQDTGEPVGTYEHDVITLWSTAAMVKEDGTWRLSEWLQDDLEEGVAECPGGS